MSGTPERRTADRKLLLFVVAVAAFAWVVIGRAEESSTGRSTGESVREEYSPGERKTVDEFGGELLDGEPFASTELKGQVVLFTAWGSWCVPCREEAPALARLAQDDAGVTVVGINVRDGDAAARAFERRHAVPYPSLRSADADEALLALGSSRAESAIPTSVVVDRSGRVAARVLGPATYVVLRELVDAVLEEPDAAGRR